MALRSRGKKNRPAVTAVIAAGGNSSRMGEDKLFLYLGDMPVLARTLLAFERCESVDSVVVVTRGERIVLVYDLFREYGMRKLKSVVAGGETRLRSVLAGLGEAGDAEYIAVHDGARPLVTPELIDAVVAAAIEHGAAVPAVPMRDTVKIVEGGAVLRTPERATLAAAQTPQVFRRDLIEAALRRADEHGWDVTDDASAVEATGAAVRVVEGEAANLKLTTPEDMQIAAALLREDE